MSGPVHLTMTSSAQPPLARLVLFLVCLSIAGSLIAGIHYFAIDHPAQAAVQIPGNNAQDVNDCIRKCPPDNGRDRTAVLCRTACYMQNINK